MRTLHTLRSSLLAITLAIVATASTGCGGYSLKGRVIQGTTPGVEVVHQMDVRLRSPAGGGPVANPNGLMPEGAGVGNVEVSVYRDGSTPNQRLADRTRSNGEGYFTLHMGDFGTGWLDEKWQAVTMMTGYANSNTAVKLPISPGKYRLLITIVPGTPTPPEKDIMEEFEQFKGSE